MNSDKAFEGTAVNRQFEGTAVNRQSNLKMDDDLKLRLILEAPVMKKFS